MENTEVINSILALEMNVTDSDLFIVSQKTIVAGGNMQYSVKFNLSGSWSKLAVVAVFTTLIQTLNVPIINGMCIIPNEVLLSNNFCVGLCGVSVDRTFSTVSKPVSVVTGADANMLAVPSKTEWEIYTLEVTEKMTAAIASAESASTSAASAVSAMEIAVNAVDGFNSIVETKTSELTEFATNSLESMTEIATSVSENAASASESAERAEKAAESVYDLDVSITMNDTIYTTDDSGNIDLGDVVQITNLGEFGDGIYQISNDGIYGTVLTTYAFGLQTLSGTMGLVSYNYVPMLYFGDTDGNVELGIASYQDSSSDPNQLYLYDIGASVCSPIATEAYVSIVEESLEADLTATYTQIMSEVDTKIATAIGTALGGSY